MCYKRLSDVAMPPEPALDWREQMYRYIDGLKPSRNPRQNDIQYSNAKKDLLEIIPISAYDEMLSLLLDKMRE